MEGQSLSSSEVTENIEYFLGSTFSRRLRGMSFVSTFGRFEVISPPFSSS